MRYILLLLLMLVSFKANSAMDCQVVPNCASLGFSTEDDDTCPENGYMYCPFDLNYKKCVGSQVVNCEKLQFSKSDKSEWCADIIKCPSDEQYTLCNAGVAVSTRCKIGDVFYANGTCFDIGEHRDSLGTPIGVVFEASEDGRNGKIVNLKDITFYYNYKFLSDKPYDGGYYDEIFWGLKDVSTGVHMYSTADELKAALVDTSSDVYNGKEATVTIASVKKSGCSLTSGEAWATSCVSVPAQAAVAFYPHASIKDNANYGAGQWWLPAIGELAMIYGLDPAGVTSANSAKGATGETIKLVNATLQTLLDKGVVAAPLEEVEYWSSTQRSNTQAYKVNMYDGKRNYYAKSNKLKVRFITDFNF
ncbi:MAG: DUF1566 domain-containing protein [Alphaproteobacteria bacterium]|nr:DUF1566 domain-containing protein [Alphaproteobacteria bacterium]